jgi:hypothetical protein
LARPVACTASPLLKPKASLTGRGPGLATAARDKSSWCVLLCLLKVGAAGIKQGASCLRAHISLQKHRLNSQSCVSQKARARAVAVGCDRPSAFSCFVFVSFKLQR